MTTLNTTQPASMRSPRVAPLPAWFGLVLALGLFLVQAGPVHSSDAVAQELADCQDEAKPAPQRIKICTALVGIAGIDNGLKAEALLNRGIARQDADDLAGALSDYTAAIALNPAYPALYVQRADAYQEMDEVPLAIEDMTRAIELAPDKADSYATRGELYVEISETVLAEADYRKALELEPAHAQALDGLKALKK